MRKVMVFVALALIVVALAAGPGQAQSRRLQRTTDSLLVAVDSLKTLLSQPPPVSYATGDLFNGLSMRGAVQGSATILHRGWFSYPVTGMPNVDGAKGIIITISWTNFEHGGFRVVPFFAPANTDTGSFWSLADSFCVADTLTTSGSHNITKDVAGKASFYVKTVPGAGYMGVRIYPWGIAHANWISGLVGTYRVVY